MDINEWLVDRDRAHWEGCEESHIRCAVAKHIAALESQLDRYRWRRVEEEMPDVWESVLVPKGYICEEAFVDTEGEWWWANMPDSRCGTVRHWMPMPPAPEEGE